MEGYANQVRIYRVVRNCGALMDFRLKSYSLKELLQNTLIDESEISLHFDFESEATATQ